MSQNKNKSCSELLMTIGLELDRAYFEFQKLVFFGTPQCTTLCNCVHELDLHLRKKLQVFMLCARVYCSRLPQAQQRYGCLVGSDPFQGGDFSFAHQPFIISKGQTIQLLSNTTIGQEESVQVKGHDLDLMVPELCFSTVLMTCLTLQNKLSRRRYVRYTKDLLCLERWFIDHVKSENPAGESIYALNLVTKSMIQKKYMCLSSY